MVKVNDPTINICKNIEENADKAKNLVFDLVHRRKMNQLTAMCLAEMQKPFLVWSLVTLLYFSYS
jgi:hypothetical protein